IRRHRDVGDGPWGGHGARPRCPADGASGQGGGRVKGKWATGIVPRNFAWVIKDRLAVSERPGGYARTHRRVRRQEEIIWIREQGFNRVVSLLPSPHNLRAYEELGVKWEHFPMTRGEAPAVLADLLPA